MEGDIQSYEIQNESTSYIITINNAAASLTVNVRNPTTTDSWKGVFSAKGFVLNRVRFVSWPSIFVSPATFILEIEDITYNAGSLKKFHVFIKMLQSALREEKDSLVLQIQDYAALQELQQKKTKPSSRSKIPKTRNLFLVLSYSTEFDRFDCFNR
jgi:hypothetical protein